MKHLIFLSTALCLLVFASPGLADEVKLNHKTEKIGDIEYQSTEEVYPVSKAFVEERAQKEPMSFPSSIQNIKSDIKQKTEVFHYPDNVYLLSNYFCTIPFSGAQQPFHCNASATIWSMDKASGSWVSTEPVRGDFETIQVSKSHPIFAAIRSTCCDHPPAWTIYNLKGKALCPLTAVPADSYDMEKAVKKGNLKCPGEKARTVRINKTK